MTKLEKITYPKKCKYCIYYSPFWDVPLPEKFKTKGVCNIKANIDAKNKDTWNYKEKDIVNENMICDIGNFKPISIHLIEEDLLKGRGCNMKKIKEKILNVIENNKIYDDKTKKILEDIVGILTKNNKDAVYDTLVKYDNWLERNILIDESNIKNTINDYSDKNITNIIINILEDYIYDK